MEETPQRQPPGEQGPLGTPRDEAEQRGCGCSLAHPCSRTGTPRAPQGIPCRQPQTLPVAVMGRGSNPVGPSCLSLPAPDPTEAPGCSFQPQGTLPGTHGLLGVLHLADAQVLQGDDATGLFILVGPSRGFSCRPDTSNPSVCPRRKGWELPTPPRTGTQRCLPPGPPEQREPCRLTDLQPATCGALPCPSSAPPCEGH